MSKLNVRKVSTIRTPGRYGDGDGLYLFVSKSGGKSWVLRTNVFGKRRDIGLGSAKLLSLSEARVKAHALRKEARAGRDPRQLRHGCKLTFEDAARNTHRNLSKVWSSKRHSEIWWSSLDRYVLGHIGTRPIETLGSPDILQVLEPIWVEKNDTAKRIKQRVAVIFDWARGAGYYPKANPVYGLEKALPAVKTEVAHMPYLPWQELPQFMAELSSREGVSARALEFIILTAARSGEVRGARWDEFHDNVWTKPATRTKTRSEHRVPLSKGAIEVLGSLRGLDDTLVFPSPNRGTVGAKSMSDTVFCALMKRMGVSGITTHGFRTTFRVWCAECAHADREVAEAALAHVFGSKVERAYNRTDLFDRRVDLMEKWSSFALGDSPNEA